MLAPPVANRASSSGASVEKKSISKTSFSFLVFFGSGAPDAAAITQRVSKQYETHKFGFLWRVGV